MSCTIVGVKYCSWDPDEEFCTLKVLISIHGSHRGTSVLIISADHNGI